MGWTFTYNEHRVDLIRELTEPQEWEAGKGRVKRVCLAKQYKGAPWKRILYAVFEDQIEGQDSKRFIAVFLLQFSNHKNVPMWGYKDMTEDDGPYETGCPLKYFDLVPWCSKLAEAREGQYCQRPDGKWDVTYPDGHIEQRDEAWWAWPAKFRARVKAKATQRRTEREAIKKLVPGQWIALKDRIQYDTMTVERVERGKLHASALGRTYRIKAKDIDFARTEIVEAQRKGLEARR